MEKEKVTVLWLDDTRNPKEYLSKKITKNSGTFYHTASFYNDFLSKFDPSFVWVKSYDEFVDYLENNPMPQLISFDYDIEGNKKGRWCVQWLLDYCKKNGLEMPRTFVHSTNPKGRVKMQTMLGIETTPSKTLKINEADIREMVSNTINELYSYDDKLSFVKDRNIVDGGNFPIKRNGQKYWVSRSNAVIAYVFCKNNNDEWCVLASQRGPKVNWPNKWNVINGYLDYGFSLEGTAAKECEEETGVRVSSAAFKHLKTDSSSRMARGDVDVIFYAILDGTTADYPTNTEKCEPGEVQVAAWVPISAIKNLNWLDRQGIKAIQILRDITATNSDNEIVNFLTQKVKQGKLKQAIFDKIIDVMKNEHMELNETTLRKIVSSVLTESFDDKLDSVIIDRNKSLADMEFDNVAKFGEKDDEKKLGDVANDIAGLIADVVNSLLDLKYLLETNEEVLKNKDKYSAITKNVVKIYDLMDNIWDENED